jgi:asparagine synthase (glutamine-hydrolysing)
VCGFAGELSFAGAADRAAVDRMAETMRSRGPDGSGAWAMDGIAMAHRRLKIIDLSAAGDQPMVDDELGLTIVFNGCIYNHRELRRELERDGYRFFSHSDTEVILKAYDRWGARCVERLFGMFAFAVFDHGRRRLTLARDRLGIKPLYIASGGQAVRFASTLPGLLAGGGVDTDLDPIALHHFFSWHAVVPAPYTILKGVRKVAPATVMTFEADGRSATETYWEADYRRRPECGHWSEQDWARAILEALETAVQRRMVADVPVGVLLSGGLDSSLIVGLLARSGQEGLATFSVGFDDVGEREGNEFRYSDVIAEVFQTDHHRIHVPTQRMLPALDGAIAAMSEPMVSHDAVAFYLLSEEVAKSLKVVQSGQGADEVFAGYSWYPPLVDTDGDGVGRYVASAGGRAGRLGRRLSDGARLDADRQAGQRRAGRLANPPEAQRLELELGQRVGLERNAVLDHDQQRAPVVEAGEHAEQALTVGQVATGSDGAAAKAAEEPHG